MLRRQCKVCGPNNIIRTNPKDKMDWDYIPEKTGQVVKKTVRTAKLPGLDGTFMVRVYTVKCSKCGHTWTYRKKIK